MMKRAAKERESAGLRRTTVIELRERANQLKSELKTKVAEGHKLEENIENMKDDYKRRKIEWLNLLSKSSRCGLLRHHLNSYFAAVLEIIRVSPTLGHINMQH
jgi:chromatin segregation and condensation protein Rec8/ScpA/Scc1 (kleisin family)